MYEYDSEGRLISAKMKYYDEDKWHDEGRMVYNYSDSDKKVTVECYENVYDAFEDLTMRIISEYDSEGKLLNEKSYELDTLNYEMNLEYEEYIYSQDDNIYQFDDLVFQSLTNPEYKIWY